MEPTNADFGSHASVLDLPKPVFTPPPPASASANGSPSASPSLSPAPSPSPSSLSPFPSPAPSDSASAQSDGDGMTPSPNKSDVPISELELSDSEREEAAAGQQAEHHAASGKTRTPLERFRAKARGIGAMRASLAESKLVGAKALPEGVIVPVDEGPRQRPCGLLLPNSTARQTWDVVIVLLLVYTVIYLPWKLAFDDRNFDPMDVVVDSLFFIDIVLAFNTAYMTRSGVLVVDRCMIAKRYLRTWFVLDLIATFPFYLFINSSASRASTLLRIPRLFKIFRFLRLLKLLRAFKFRDLFKRLEGSSEVHPGIFRLLKLLFWVVTITHFSGCVWVFIANTEESVGNDGWLVAAGLDGKSDLATYNIGVYWAYVTLTGTGFGDIVPTTDSERLYTSCMMLVGVSLFAYATATISSVIGSMDRQATHYRVRMEQLRSFMKHARLPRPLRTKLRKHFRFVWAESRSPYDTEDIMSQMPLHLRREVSIRMHEDLVSSCAFLRDKAEPDFVSELVMALKPSRYSTGETIAHYGSKVSEFHIVKTGVVEAQSQMDSKVYMRFPAGSTLGEVGLLITGTWGANMVAGTDVMLLSIRKRHLQHILSEYPESKQAMRQIAAARYRKLLLAKRQRRESVTGWEHFQQHLNPSASNVNSIVAASLDDIADTVASEAGDSPSKGAAASSPYDIELSPMTENVSAQPSPKVDGLNSAGSSSSWTLRRLNSGHLERTSSSDGLALPPLNLGSSSAAASSVGGSWPNSARLLEVEPDEDVSAPALESLGQAELFSRVLTRIQRLDRAVARNSTKLEESLRMMSRNSLAY